MQKTNPLVWGAILAIIAGALVSIALMTGPDTSNGPLLDHPGAFIGAAFFWGWVAGHAKNWYGNRINGPRH